MRILFTEPAKQDLLNIGAYLREHFPHLQQSTIRDLYSAVRELKKFPNRGRTGREAGTRELVSTRLPYIAVYRLKESTIEVLRIWHGAHDRQ